MQTEKDSIKMNVETESLEFVFDPKKSSFVTNIYFPDDINYEFESGNDAMKI